MSPLLTFSRTARCGILVGTDVTVMTGRTIRILGAAGKVTTVTFIRFVADGARVHIYKLY